MTFASRITRSPRPFAADAAQDVRAALPWAKGPVADVIAGTAGCSPFLRGLIEKEGTWLEAALDDPEAAVKTLFSDLRNGALDQVANDLRQAKRRIALLTALADLGGVWPLETVTGTLSDLADLACARALRAALMQEVRRGKLPGLGEDQLDTAGGMVVLAMGKMGAGELNYSSDIDLICLFDESRYSADDFHEARAGFIRATRRMAATLGDLTGEGYVFRTDLRLRPDPSVTPVCMGLEAAERYYESLGRTWERAAYIKARPCAGDIAAGDRFLSDLRPFVWRRHLDFAAIQDAHDMRLRIREHKGLGGAITLPGHNMKLGRGGIREIEFFTQTRQIIAGGRDPELRVRGTVAGLGVLAKKGWIPADVADALTDHYRSHREVEHRLQMINDQQTHDLPDQREGFARLACLMDVDETVWRRDLTERLNAVHELTEGFFASDSSPAPEPTPLENSPIIARWPRYPALRSARAVEIFKRLRPEILSRLESTARPEEALLAFDGFLAGLPAGVQLFSLFEANHQLIDLLVDITGTSPDLARHLSRNARVFDAVIGGGFFSDWPGKKALTDELTAKLAREADYERKLDAARRWKNEWHFRVGVHLLRGLTDADEASVQYADLAEATLATLWPVVQAEFALKHGAPPGRGAIVLGMGSLGAGRLHPRSDLDVIVIYDPDGAEMSEGAKPLQVRVYYARLTQALITALTAPMAQGKLYEVDMRLRPSGNQGPVATSLVAFRAYQTEDAWNWEHLALTRARVVAGPRDLVDDVTAFRAELLAAPRDQKTVLGDVAVMRARIAGAKGPGAFWDPKLGRGRMQDIELAAQAGALLSCAGSMGLSEGLSAAVIQGWLIPTEAEHLAQTHALCWGLQVGARLISDAQLDPDKLGLGGCAFLQRVTGLDSMKALAETLQARTLQAAEILDAALPQAGEAE
ncbi:glutamine-synthetase adenylyltransferase [Puniceibacterium sediminis]|uniref:Glutamate-ammonia-ligase adenylyltransferase n=1 Tax=Puniceibacterium sediminis TaxID=1608407 RepID=A0A238XQG1_9RHOB|nr:glutamine-synthetase adenylyltransferase [Puniceibacterium sediminis]SNR60219.1 glutamate-ammonia-ligase adenylyltransferase [Puniceibacterium sediminis]